MYKYHLERENEETMYNNKSVLRDTVSGLSGWPQVNHGGWLTEGRVLFLSRDVKTTQSNQYLPVSLTSFNFSNSRF